MREGVSMTAGRGATPDMASSLYTASAPDVSRRSERDGNRTRGPTSHCGHVCFHAAAVAILLSLGACANKPTPPVNSYCVVKATETIDMRDPGLQGLWPANQGAVLTGDDNFRQLCQRTNNPGGPR